MKNVMRKIINSRRTRKYLWSMKGRPKYANLHGVTINLRSTAISDRVARGMYIGPYERFETRIVESVLRDDDRVLELGTGIGYLSALCAKRIGSDKVWTVEANPELEEPIRETYKLNGVSPSLQMCVLGEADGEVTFHISENYTGSSLQKSEGRPVTIRQRSFQDLLSEARPTFLICDIEGGEVPLLLNTTLEDITKICIEMHPQVIGDKACSSLIHKFLSDGFLCNWRLSAGNVFLFYREGQA